MHVVNVQHIEQMHIVNVQHCMLWMCKIAPISTFIMCIVACVQCDSPFRMGDACYECAAYRSNAYCEYATLLVVNVQIITIMHVHNVHCSMLQMCFDTFTIDTHKCDNFSICMTSLLVFHLLSSTYIMFKISGDACCECATHWPNAYWRCATLHVVNV